MVLPRLCSLSHKLPFGVATTLSPLLWREGTVWEWFWFTFPFACHMCKGPAHHLNMFPLTPQKIELKGLFVKNGRSLNDILHPQSIPPVPPLLFHSETFAVFPSMIKQAEWAGGGWFEGAFCAALPQKPKLLVKALVLSKEKDVLKFKRKQKTLMNLSSSYDFVISYIIHSGSSNRGWYTWNPSFWTNFSYWCTLVKHGAL